MNFKSWTFSENSYLLHFSLGRRTLVVDHLLHHLVLLLVLLDLVVQLGVVKGQANV